MAPPKKPDAGVVLTVRIKPESMQWLDDTASDLGIDRAELARKLLIKGRAAFRAGWRP